MKLSRLRKDNNCYIGHLLKSYLEDYPQSKVIERRKVFFSFCDSFSPTMVSQLSASKLRDWFLDLKTINNYTDRNWIAPLNLDRLT